LATRKNKDNTKRDERIEKIKNDLRGPCVSSIRNFKFQNLSLTA
jgi:hypothetical protein